MDSTGIGIPTQSSSSSSSSESQEGDLRRLYLKLAFLACEPPNCVLSLAREAGGGSITPGVQHFILENCVRNVANEATPKNNAYTRTIMKKIIADVELSSDVIVEDLYEEYGRCMTSNSEEGPLSDNYRIYKEISFLSMPSHSNTCSKFVSLAARLLCSTNMLEGDTGCSLWPSSLFMSEFILSYPEIFSNKFCFEVGSGVGLLGITLDHVGASKVLLTDGDVSALANMKINLELNNLSSESLGSGPVKARRNKVECKLLSWEHASANELQDYKPDIIRCLTSLLAVWVQILSMIHYVCRILSKCLPTF